MNTVRPKLRAQQISKALLVAVALAVFALAGCSRSSDTEPVTVQPTATTPPVPPVTAPEAVALAREAMTDLASFRFELTHNSGFTALSGGLELSRAGGVVAQDGLDLEAEAKIGRAFVRIEAIVIDEQTWMTNPLTGAWSEIPPEDSPFSFLDPVKLVADILGDTSDAVFPDDPVSSNELTVTGRIPATTLAALVGSVDLDAVPAVTLSLNAETYLLNKIVIFGVAQPDDDENTTRVITLSEFDKPVSLEQPI